MKKKLFVTIMTGAVIFSVISGVAMASKAGNVSDTYYEFHNTVASGNTSARTKLDATKTYIYPNGGPALTYTVQGSSNGSTWNNRSSSHTVYNGTKASFTNFVYENHEGSARLHLDRTVYAETLTYGVWSPDSTQNYTIYY